MKVIRFGGMGIFNRSQPNIWFESFRDYLDIYLQIVKRANRSEVKVTEFTIGAELYSMTVGIEDQWIAHPHGFPGRWVELLSYVKRRLARRS